MADRDDDAPLAHPHDPTVLAAIRAVLLENRWPRHELEDGVATVEVRAWASKPRPGKVGAWKALCRKIAKDQAIDRTRSEMAGGKDSVRPTDRADEHEASNNSETMETAIDRRRAIDEIAANLEPNERPVFVKWALGSTQAEIAEELAMKPRQVSRHVTTMRSKFRKALVPAGLMATVLAVALYVRFGDKVDPDTLGHNQQPSPSSLPSASPNPSPAELAARQRAKADELRKLAGAECAAGRWPSCNKDLNEASELDPPGEQARGVQRLRRKVERGETQNAMGSKSAPGARSLRPEAKPKLVAALAAASGQPLRLVCARGAEPAHLCDQLAQAITSAGWTVTRATVAEGAAVPYGMLIEVATDAGDATESAADALAGGLEQAYLIARGPDDTPPGGDAPLRLTVGAP